MLLVGHEHNGGDSFWVIKNSWGVRWGDKGFAYLTYGRDGNNSGICFATRSQLPEMISDKLYLIVYVDIKK